MFCFILEDTWNGGDLMIVFAGEREMLWRLTPFVCVCISLDLPEFFYCLLNAFSVFSVFILGCTVATQHALSKCSKVIILMMGRVRYFV